MLAAGLVLLVLTAAAGAVLLQRRRKAAGPPSWVALALWSLSAALFMAWVVLTSRAGVRADAEGTSGNILDTVWWLVAAVAVAVAALAQRRLTSSRTGRASR